MKNIVTFHKCKFPYHNDNIYARISMFLQESLTVVEKQKCAVQNIAEKCSFVVKLVKVKFISSSWSCSLTTIFFTNRNERKRNKQIIKLNGGWKMERMIKENLKRRKRKMKYLEVRLKLSSSASKNSSESLLPDILVRFYWSGMSISSASEIKGVLSSDDSSVTYTHGNTE